MTNPSPAEPGIVTPDGDAKFDVFISYARKSSAQQARALRRALERYARAWNRARSTVVFLDDQSMSASDSLEATIRSALADSRWLMVLLSEGAAQSLWVDKELSWWLANRDARKILLVHINGTVEWSGKDFSASSTAVPSALFGALSEEPRWVDLTWFGADIDDAESDPRFADRVLELYCPIHGMDRDTAAAASSAAIRRAKRLALGAISALTFLLVLAVVAGSLAWWQRGIALDETKRAVARQLASESLQIRDTDVARSSLLAVQAWTMRDDGLTRSAMLGALMASPQLDGQVVAPDEVVALTGSSDGTVVYMGLKGGELLRWSPEYRTKESLGKLEGGILDVKCSSDGSVVIARGLNQSGVWVDGRRIGGALPEGSVAISRSGHSVAINSPSGGGQDTTLTIWQVEPDVGLIKWGAERLVVGNIGLPSDEDLVVQTTGLHSEVITLKYELASWNLIARTVSRYDGIPDRGPDLSPFGDSGFNAYLIVDTARDDPTATKSHPTIGAEPLSLLYGETYALSADGQSLVATKAGSIEVRKLDRTGSRPTTVESAWSGEAVTSLLAMPGSDVVLSSAGKTVTRWTPSNSQALTSVRDLMRDSGSLSECDECGIPAPYPNSHGTMVALTTGQNFPSTTAIRVVARDGHSLPVVARRRFLAWRDDDHYFAAPSEVPGVIELHDVAKEAPEASWQLPGQTSSVYEAHWYPARGELAFIADGTLSTLNVASGRITSSGQSADEFSPDGSLILVHQLTPSGDAVTRVLLADDLTEVRQIEGYAYASGSHTLVVDGAQSTVLADGDAPDLAVAAPRNNHIAVSPNDDVILIRDKRGQVSVLARQTGAKLGTLSVREDVLSDSQLGFSSDASTAVLLLPGSPARPDAALFFDLRPSAWRDELCSSVGRSMTTTDLRGLMESITGPDGPLACAN